MIAIKIGTTSWRQASTLAADEVEFTGQYLYEADGFTSAMVWDAGINNVRARNAAETLAAAKTKRIEADRQECRRRLTEHYGDALEQVSRASGIGYSATAQQNHAAGVAAARDASNVARDLINAATTVAQVEAVTVQWPVLP